MADEKPLGPKAAALRALESVPPAALGISPTAMLVLWRLVCRMNRVERAGRVWPSIATISEDTSLGRSAVKERLAELVEAGLVTLESGAATGRANEYAVQVEELTRRAGVHYDPNAKPVQRQLGPMLAALAAKKRIAP